MIVVLLYIVCLLSFVVRVDLLYVCLYYMSLVVIVFLYPLFLAEL